MSPRSFDFIYFYFVLHRKRKSYLIWFLFVGGENKKKERKKADKRGTWYLSKRQAKEENNPKNVYIYIYIYICICKEKENEEERIKEVTTLIEAEEKRKLADSQVESDAHFDGPFRCCGRWMNVCGRNEYSFKKQKIKKNKMKIRRRRRRKNKTNECRKWMNESNCGYPSWLVLIRSGSSVNPHWKCLHFASRQRENLNLNQCQPPSPPPLPPPHPSQFPFPSILFSCPSLGVILSGVGIHRRIPIAVDTHLRNSNQLKIKMNADSFSWIGLYGRCFDLKLMKYTMGTQTRMNLIQNLIVIWLVELLRGCLS